MLAKAKSNIPENGDGRRVYEKFVKPAIITPDLVGAHYAISSVFESYPEQAHLYAFSFHQEERRLFTSGAARLAIGNARVTFEVTKASDLLTYAVLYMGSHNLNCWVHVNGHLPDHTKLAETAREAFERGDFSEIIRLMDHEFGPIHYSLKSLFRDEQRKVLNQILSATREEIYSAYKLIADRHAPLLRVLADLNAPTLDGLKIAVEVVLNSEIRAQFESENMDPERVRSLLAEIQGTKVALDSEILAYACKRHFDRLSERLISAPEDGEILKRFIQAAKLVRQLPFGVNLWKPQNVYYETSRSLSSELSRRLQKGDETAQQLESLYNELGEALGFSSAMKFDAKPQVDLPASQPAEPALASAAA